MDFDVQLLCISTVLDMSNSLQSKDRGAFVYHERVMQHAENVHGALSGVSLCNTGKRQLQGMWLSKVKCSASLAELNKGCYLLHGKTGHHET